MTGSTPPERLRHALEELRERGYSFAAAWPAAQGRALRKEPRETVVFWRIAWREQRGAWASAYSRQPWPVNRRPRLELPEDEHRRMARTLLVA